MLLVWHFKESPFRNYFFYDVSFALPVSLAKAFLFSFPGRALCDCFPMSGRSCRVSPSPQDRK